MSKKKSEAIQHRPQQVALVGRCGSDVLEHHNCAGGVQETHARRQHGGGGTRAGAWSFLTLLQLEILFGRQHFLKLL